MDMISDKLRNMADEIRTQIVQDRRYLHQIPEIGNGSAGDQRLY